MATKILLFRDLYERGIPFSRTHIRRMVDAGTFPAPVFLGKRSIGWPEDDVEMYLQRIRDERDDRQAAKRDAKQAARRASLQAPDFDFATSDDDTPTPATPRRGRRMPPPQAQ